MLPISNFEPVFHSGLGFDAARSAPWNASTKRKRGTVLSRTGFEDPIDDEPLSENESGLSSSPSWNASSFTSVPEVSELSTRNVNSETQRWPTSLSMEKAVRAQEHSHGLSEDTKHRSHLRVNAQIEHDLGALKPPLSTTVRYDAREIRIQGLRQRHLAVLMTILHRCLLEADYIRASRAWGMLLRSERYGQSADLRGQCRWGLGAEILLYCSGQCSQQNQSETHTGVDSDISETLQGPEFQLSVEGFERARRYYERLAVQYPYRKAFPLAIGAPDFYYAMFGLWIDVVQGRCTPAIHAEHKSGSGMDYDNGLSTAIQDEVTDSLGGVRRRTLQCARDIISRLDKLLVSPQYSNHVRFLRLRENVLLWIGDLSSMDISLGVRSDSDYERKDSQDNGWDIASTE